MKIYSKKLQVFALFLLFTLALNGQTIRTSEACNELYRSGLNHIETSNYGAAILDFQKLAALSEVGSTFAEESDYFLRLCALEMGNANGKALMEQFVQDNPNSPHVNKAYLSLANSAFSRKNYKLAIVSYQKIEQQGLKGDDLDEFIYKSGYCNLELGKRDIAKVNFAELKDQPGNYAEISKYYWAHICFLDGKYDLALAEFQKIEKSPLFSAEIPFYKAQIYFAQEKYQTVVEMGPALMSSAKAVRKLELAKTLAVSYYKLGEYKSAIPYIELYEKEKDITLLQYYVAGYCQGKVGLTEAAISNLEKSTQKKDALGQNSYYELAGLYVKLEDKQKAMMAFQNASSLDFNPTIKEDALFQYAKITYELNYSPFNESIKAFDRYISEYPNSENNKVAYEYLSKVFMTTRNYKDALTALDKIKIKSSSIKKAYQRVVLNRGIELFRDLKFEDALSLFEKLTAFNGAKNNFYALSYYWRAEAYFRLGKTEEALVDYHKFQAIPASNGLKELATSNYNIGYVLFNKEDYEGAASWLVKYTEGKQNKGIPLYSDALNRLGDCSFVRSRFSEAIGYYQQAYENGSTDADYALFQKAFCHGLLNDHSVKISELSQLPSEFPKSNYLDDALFETGRAFERLQDNAKAIENYKAMIATYPSSPYKPKALIQLGLLAYNGTDFDASTAYFKQVAENYPNSPEAKSALSGIKNNYVETNKVGDYISYAKSLGQSATPSQNEQDSLTYYAAEKLYMAKDPRATEELGKYLVDFPAGNFILNVNFYKAEMAYNAGKFDEALVNYNFIITQPANIFTENALLKGSELAYKAADYPKALDYYQRLETAASNTDGSLLSLVGRLRCYFELKQFDEAFKMGLKIRSMDKIPPELDREVVFKSAKSAIELHEPLKALPLWRKLALDAKSLEGAEAKYRVCEYYLGENKLKEAEDEVNDFIEKNTPHQYWLGKSFLLLAKVYEKQKDVFQATNTLKSIIENYEQKEDGIIEEAQQALKALEASNASTEKAVSAPQSTGDETIKK